MQLTDNTIFITGATSGIGRGLAEAFHRLGNKVIISGRRQALLDEVTAANQGMEGIRLDITDLADINRVAEDLKKRFPDLNVLVNNAGIMPFADPAGELDDEVTQKIIATNLLGPIRMTSALIEHLKRQPRATVLHTTSVVAYLPIAGAAVYSATKAALHTYSLTQRFALRDTSVRVQEIAPPWVETGLVGADSRAMPIDDFIEQTMRKLASDDEEVFVDGMKEARGNPGPDEHALINSFNTYLVENPIPMHEAA